MAGVHAGSYEERLPDDLWIRESNEAVYRLGDGLPPDALCKACGYHLQGLPDPRCPECGRSFDPFRPATFRSDIAAAAVKRLRQRQELQRQINAESRRREQLLKSVANQARPRRVHLWLGPIVLAVGVVHQFLSPWQWFWLWVSATLLLGVAGLHLLSMLWNRWQAVRSGRGGCKRLWPVLGWHGAAWLLVMSKPWPALMTGSLLLGLSSTREQIEAAA